MGNPVLRLVFRPFDFDEEVPREHAPGLLGLSLLFGLALAVPGLLVAWKLSALEQEAWAASTAPGTRYLSFEKVFFLPAFFGLLLVFSGTFRALTAYFVWLTSPGRAQWLLRMLLGVVLGSITGAIALWLAFVAMPR